MSVQPQTLACPNPECGRKRTSKTLAKLNHGHCPTCGELL